MATTTLLSTPLPFWTCVITFRQVLSNLSNISFGNEVSRKSAFEIYWPYKFVQVIDFLPIFLFLAKMLSFLLRDDNILARNANIRKIYMQTITWTDFNNDIWITTLEKYVIDKILSCKKRGVNLNGSLYYVFLIFGWFLFLIFPIFYGLGFLNFSNLFSKKHNTLLIESWHFHLFQHCYCLVWMYFNQIINLLASFWRKQTILLFIS